MFLVPHVFCVWRLVSFGWVYANGTSDDKTVCSCSGKTVWQEREEQRDRGML